MFINLQNELCRIILHRFSITCIGLNTIDPGRNYIFAMNHQSIADIPIAYSLLIPVTKRRLNVFLSFEFYKYLWPLVKPFGAIPIYMNKNNADARAFNRTQIKKGISQLQIGANILVYPEGIIYGGLNSTVIHGHTGVIRLAIQSGIPIIPIGITGSNIAYPYLLQTRNPLIIKRNIPIRITIGQEISMKRYADLDLSKYSEQNRSILRMETNHLMNILSDLSGLPNSL